MKLPAGILEAYQCHVAGPAAVLAAAEFVDAPGCSLGLHGLFAPFRATLPAWFRGAGAFLLDERLLVDNDLGMLAAVVGDSG